MNRTAIALILPYCFQMNTRELSCHNMNHFDLMISFHMIGTGFQMTGSCLGNLSSGLVLSP